MKIGYIYDAVYPWVKGGAEKRIHELSHRLAARGHEVHCYGMKWWPGEAERQSGGVFLHGICPPMPLYSGGRRSIGEAAYFAGRLLALRTDCEVVDCQNFPYLSCFSARLMAGLGGRRLFITWHEVWGGYWRQYLGGAGLAGRSVEWAAAKLADKNIAVSERTERELSALGARGVCLLENGIDGEKIAGVAPAEQPSDVIAVGRLVEHKNVPLLIEALGLIRKDMPELKAVIVGDGPERESLERLVRERGLAGNVLFTGFVEDYNRAIALMKSSGVFVSASTREGFGMAALEANACGLPVVTVRHRMNAVMDLVKEDTGAVCSAEAEELAGAIMGTLQARKRMKRRCLEEAARYDWERICDRAERIYDNKP